MNNKKLKLLILVLVMFSFTFFMSIGKTKAIYREVKSTSLSLTVLDPSSTATVKFYLNDGTNTYTEETYNVSDTLGALTTPTRTNYNFMGWYDSTASNANKVDHNTVVTGDMNLYAHWVKIICKKATAMNTETCAGSNGCRTSGTGYSSTNTLITYGTVYGTDSPISGDAFDCDIDADDTYDETDNGKHIARFYFVREKENQGSEDTAVLIYYTSYDSNGRVDSQNTIPDTNIGSDHYTTASGWLPTSNTTGWEHPGLIDFDGNNGKITRFLSVDDLETVCGPIDKTATGTDPNATATYFTACFNKPNAAPNWYMFENSRFQSSSLGRAGIWLEYDSTSQKYYRIQTGSLTVNHYDAQDGGNNMARPVIEIPMSALDGFINEPRYSITFETHGGTAVTETRKRYNGEELGSLPTTTRDHYTLDGWYATYDSVNDTYSDQVSASTIVSSAMTIHAKWTPVPTCEVTLVLYGGTGLTTPVTVDIGQAYDPGTPTKDGSVFGGWYTDDQFNNQYDSSTPISTSTLTLHAKWIVTNYAARVVGVGDYDTLAEAITHVPTGTSSSTKVILLRDVTLDTTVTIPNNKWVEFDTGSYTLSGSSVPLFTNNGKLDIVGGTLTASGGAIVTMGSSSTLNVKGGTLSVNTANVIDMGQNSTVTIDGGTLTGSNQKIINGATGGTINISGGSLTNTSPDSNNVIEVMAGTLNMTGGVITNHATGAAINNRNGGTVYISGGEIYGTNTTKGQAIYIEKAASSVYISGDAYIENVSGAANNLRAAVDNTEGTLVITGGTIVSKGYDAIGNRNKSTANTTIGINDDPNVIDNTTPIIRGKTYAIRHATGTVTIYDGVYQSGTSGGISGSYTKPNGTALVGGNQVTIGSDNYYEYYLGYTSGGPYTVTFDPDNGGSTTTETGIASEATMTSSGRTMPTPTKTNYIFDKWFVYKEVDNQVYDAGEFTSTTPITDDITVMAKWRNTIAVATVSPSSLSISVHDTDTITVTDSDEAYTFSSDDSTIATVDANGVVTGVGEGQTTITITGSESGLTRTVTVDVGPAQVTTHTVTFKKYSADQSAYATKTVADNGNLTGNMPADPTETNYVFAGWYINGNEMTPFNASTTVTGALTVIAKWKETIGYATVSSTLTVNQGSTETISITPHTQGDLVETPTFTSSNSNIATVNSSGVVTGVGPGTTTITVAGATTSKTVTVTVPATVTFKKHSGDSSPYATKYVVVNGNLSGDMPADPTETDYVFDGWYANNQSFDDSVTISGNLEVVAHWKEKVSIATVSPSSLSLTLGGSTATITVSASVQGETVENYTFSIDDSTVATVDSSTGVVTPVGVGTATVTITGTSTATQTVSVTVTSQVVNTHTVHFKLESSDTTDYDTMTVNDNAILGSLPNNPTKTGYTFKGWYTDGPNPTKINEETIITGDVTFYADWDKLVCMKATVLHSYNSTDFGTIPGANSPEGGDAYDCDVDGDDDYLELDQNDQPTYSERFYYLTTDENAISSLIFYNNSNQNNGNLSIECKADAIAYSALPFTSGPTTAATLLPTTSQWTNVSLHSTPRQMYNEVGGTTSSGNTLGTYDYAGKAARFATLDEIKAATTTTLNGTSGELASYTFLLENTVSYGDCRSNYWLETPVSNEAKVHRINGATTGNSNRGIGKANGNSGVRPVIEVPTRLIEGAPIMYGVTFNSMGGSAVAGRSVAANAQLGALPTAPTKANHVFGGWYTTTSYNTEVTSTRVIHDDVEFFAKWIPSISQATITPSTLEIDLNVNDTETITITGPSGMESYTITSSNSSIASINSSTKVVTGVSAGTAIITITGDLSGDEIHIIVVVGAVPSGHMISFDPDNGDDPTIIYVDDGEEIGSNMPNDPSNTGVTFDGWFLLDGNGDKTNTMIDSSRVINDVEYYQASYYGSNDVAAIGPNYYTTIGNAINAVTDTTPTEIRLLRDITNPSGRTTVNSGKNITINAQGHTMSCGNSTANNLLYADNGILTLKNGTFTCNKSGLATLETSGKTNPKSTIYIEPGTTVTNTGDRGAIYNSGAVYIRGGTLESSTGLRAVIMNGNSGARIEMSGGTVTQTATAFDDDGKYDGKGAIKVATGTVIITGGTVTSYSTDSAAIDKEEGGTLTIGTDDTDNSYDATSPVIQGEWYGVYATSNYSVYDGIIKGKGDNDQQAVNDETKITGTETGSTKQNGTDGNYYTLYYTDSLSPTPTPTPTPEPTPTSTPVPSTYTITFESIGGTVSPATATINQGDPITSNDLPTATWGSKTLDGWYLDEDYTNAVVLGTTIPTEDTTIYAKWTYTPSGQKVQFDPTSDAMKTYFSNISTWKDLAQATFQTTMKSNFDNYSCSSCNAENNCNNPLSGTQCDKPVAHTTSVNAAIDVYLYDETNHVILSKAIYATNANDGEIINLIPGQAYYWEKHSDPSVNGLVESTAQRRTIDAGNVRNVRDLGGISVDTDGDGTVDGTLKYGKLYRGAKLSSSNDDVTLLTNLGITREIDVRPDSDGSSQARLPVLDNGTGGTDIVIENYLINRTAYTPYSWTHGNSSGTTVQEHSTNATALKNAMKSTMQYIINGDSIYFHCTIGTDRTGTLAYFLEGLLGVSEEDRIEDYELSYYFGLVKDLGARDRYHDDLTSTNIYPRFLFMRTAFDTNQKIYNWFVEGDSASEKIADDALIAAFRTAMINYN